MPALVLDAHLKSALVSIRSLAKKGIHVVVGAERGTAMGLHSRYAAGTFTYPSPLQHREAFLEAVCRAARTTRLQRRNLHSPFRGLGARRQTPSGGPPGQWRECRDGIR